MLIELVGVHFAYPDHPVLADLDLSLATGERLHLDGDNGSGKSTVLRIVTGLSRPSAGTVRLFGEKMRGEADFVRMRPRLGLVFQHPDEQLFSPTVLDDVAFGPLNLGRGRTEARADAERALDLVGLPGFGERITYRLSGGEKRLVSLATVLAMRPEVLLLDEPTAGLDATARARIKGVLTDLGLAMVIASHDVDFLTGLIDRTLRLNAGTGDAAR